MCGQSVGRWCDRVEAEVERAVPEQVFEERAPVLRGRDGLVAAIARVRDAVEQHLPLAGQPAPNVRGRGGVLVLVCGSGVRRPIIHRVPVDDAQARLPELGLLRVCDNTA